MKLDEATLPKKRANTGSSDPELAAVIKKPAVPHTPAIPLNSETDDELEAVKGGEEDDGVIEDASDIGDQNDDMSEVLEHVDEGVIDLG